MSKIEQAFVLKFEFRMVLLHQLLLVSFMSRKETDSLFEGAAALGRAIEDPEQFAIFKKIYSEYYDAADLNNCDVGTRTASILVQLVKAFLEDVLMQKELVDEATQKVFSRAAVIAGVKELDKRVAMMVPMKDEASANDAIKMGFSSFGKL